MAKGMPAEMIELRKKLDEMGVLWWDASDVNELCPLEHATRYYGGYTLIWRTQWCFGRHKYSAICGFGSYGCVEDLLELMIDRTEPVGWLSAEDVIEMMVSE